MTMMNHTLKTVQPFYNSLESGDKTFEVRLNDRNFAVGDTLTLEEFPYSGREQTREVSYVLTHEQFPQGLKEGYVILGFVNNFYIDDDDIYNFLDEPDFDNIPDAYGEPDLYDENGFYIQQLTPSTY